MKHRLRILLAAVLFLLALFPSPAVAESAKVRQGDKQVAARQYKKALKSFRDAIRKDPNDAEAMTRIGDFHASGQGVPRSGGEMVPPCGGPGTPGRAIPPRVPV